MKRTPMIRKTPMSRGKGFAAMTAKRLAKATEKRKATVIKAGKGLRQSRSTGKPTAAHLARWERARSIGCVACHLNGVDHVNRGVRAAPAQPRDLEMHHLLSGGRRISHEATVCLCHFHHQGKRLPRVDVGYKVQAVIYGPSLGREPRRFREWYGTDQELLAYQEVMLARLSPPEPNA